MVTLAELESATSGAQNRRATKLRYNVIKWRKPSDLNRDIAISDDYW